MAIQPPGSVLQILINKHAVKTLIVFYSFSQNNEKLANLLQKKLGADLEKIEPVKNRTRFSILFDLLFNRLPAIKSNSQRPGDYEHIVFVAPIWAAKIASPLKSFIVREKHNIRSYSFITICSGAAGQLGKITKQLLDLTGKKPDAICELSLNELFKHFKERATMYVPNYQINDDDLGFFDTRIDEFLSEDSMPLARGWQVKHEYGD